MQLKITSLLPFIKKEILPHRASHEKVGQFWASCKIYLFKRVQNIMTRDIAIQNKLHSERLRSARPLGASSHLCRLM